MRGICGFLGIGALMAVSVMAAAAEPEGAVSTLSPNQLQACQTLGAPAEREKACETILNTPRLRQKDAALAHYHRGLAFADLRQLDRAIADFSAAISLDADLWPARWTRATILGERREYEGAVADWTEIIDRNPQIASLHKERGTDFDYLGRAGEAIADFSKAIELAKPSDPIAQFYEDRAGAHEGAHHWQAAIADYSEALRLDARMHPARLGRARVEFLSGDTQAAIADLRAITDGNPPDNYFLLWLFLAETRAGRDAAEEVRARASRTDTKVWPGPIIQALLGDVRPEEVKPPAQPSLWSDRDQAAAAQCEMAFFFAPNSTSSKGSATKPKPCFVPRWRRKLGSTSNTARQAMNSNV